MKDVVILCHWDFDGKSAANTVLKALHFTMRDASKKIIPCPEYDMELDLSDVGSDTIVYVVDYAPTVEQMKFLLDNAKEVIWIDHHAKAFNKFDEINPNIKGLRYNGISGVELTYAYMFIMTLMGEGNLLDFDPDTDTNTAFMYMKYIGDRDVWNWKYGDDTLYFNSGLSAFDTSPESNLWYELEYDKKVKEVIEVGKAIEGHKNSIRKQLINGNGFFANLTDPKGNKFSAVAFNTVTDNANEIKSLMNEEPNVDLFIKFSFNGMEWSYTIYSDKVDVSEIAILFGGGGHKGAAGFRTKDFVLEFISKI